MGRAIVGRAQPAGEAAGAAEVEEGVRQAGAVEEVLQRARGRLQQLDGPLDRLRTALVGEDRDGVQLLAQLLRADRPAGWKVRKRRSWTGDDGTSISATSQRAVEAGRPGHDLAAGEAVAGEPGELLAHEAVAHREPLRVLQQRLAPVGRPGVRAVLAGGLDEAQPELPLGDVAAARAQAARQLVEGRVEPGAGGLRRHLALLVLA